MKYLNLFLLLILLGASVLAAPISSPPRSSLERRAFPKISGSYNAQQVKQLNEAFSDAIQLAHYAIMAPKSTTNAIIPKYFNKADYDVVTKVFKNIHGELKGKDRKPNTEGSPFLGQVTIVDDYPNDDDKTLACSKSTEAEARDWDTDNPKIIVYPRAFKYGGIAQEYPGAKKVNCESIGTTASRKMETHGSLLLHEFTRFSKLVSPPLDSRTLDYAYGSEVQNIEKSEAKYNADSYTWYANEIMWSMICSRKFGKAT